MDEELAEHLEDTADERGGSKAAEVSVSEATPEVLLLLRLVALAQAQLQQKQPKKIPFPPLPTIRTARTAVRERRRRKHRGRLEQLIADAKVRWTAEQAQPPPPDAAPAVASWADTDQST